MSYEETYSLGRKYPPQRGFWVRVEVLEPHFSDTQWDSMEIIRPTLIWAADEAEAIEITRSTLIPPHYDPAMLEIIVEKLV